MVTKRERLWDTTLIKKTDPLTPITHTILANLRLVLDAEVQPGNQSGSSYSTPGPIELLGRIGSNNWPEFVRGDSDWDNNSVMERLEE